MGRPETDSKILGTASLRIASTGPDFKNPSSLLSSGLLSALCALGKVRGSEAAALPSFRQFGLRLRLFGSGFGGCWALGLRVCSSGCSGDWILGLLDRARKLTR